jgi:hypothetical protein
MNKLSGDKMVAKPKRLPFYNASKLVKFEGRIDALKGHTANSSAAQKSNWEKRIDEISKKEMI